MAETEGEIAEWGLGVARMTGDDPRWGGSLEMLWEGFKVEPWVLGGRYQLGVLTDKHLYHDLSFDVGWSWRKVGLSAGYRLFLNHRRNSYGPQALLRVWF